MSDDERDRPLADEVSGDEAPDGARRRLLKMAGAAVALTLAPGVTVLARDLVFKGGRKGRCPCR